MSIVERIKRLGEAREVSFGEVRRLRSGKLVVKCECGEELVLVGREHDWRWGRVLFECRGCGEKFVLF